MRSKIYFYDHKYAVFAGKKVTSNTVTARDAVMYSRKPDRRLGTDATVCYYCCQSGGNIGGNSAGS